MQRRDFLRRSARTLRAAFLTKTSVTNFALANPVSLSQKFNAQDEVILGRTGIRTSRLAMGTVGFGGSSNQTRFGTSPLTHLLLNGFHESGLRFFDSADSYGSHPYVAAALKQIPRDKVTVLTKTDTRDPAGVRADIDRYRRAWRRLYRHSPHSLRHGRGLTKRYPGVMDVPSEAKQKGVIGLMAFRATRCRRCALLPLLRGATSTVYASIRSAPTWMPSPIRSSA